MPSTFFIQNERIRRSVTVTVEHLIGCWVSFQSLRLQGKKSGGHHVFIFPYGTEQNTGILVNERIDGNKLSKNWIHNRDVTVTVTVTTQAGDGDNAINL